MELIPLALRMDVREFCVRELKFREITEIFEGSGIQAGTRDPSKPIPGVRRELVENYYASLDFTRVWDAHKFLSVISMMLSRMSISDSSKAALRAACLSHGFEIEGTTVRLPALRSNSNIRNIIFASTGPKPEIIMTDALTNSIQVISRGGDELIYDRPIISEGLSWGELIDWWREKTHSIHPDSVEIEQDLVNRLSRSLESEPERVLFRAYCFKVCDGHFGAQPALLPQVYLHYDPYTVKQLDGQKRLVRQRMDFLLLLPGAKRAVIEVDGKQHYADADGKANARLYSEMVAEDRRLRLSGYEVYRFGGYELSVESAENTVIEFFRPLLHM